jgi:glucose-6-phosphate isomerase
VTTTIQPLTKRKAWKSLATHSKEIKKLHLGKLFAQGQQTRRTVYRRSRRIVSGLFQKPHHRPDARAAAAVGEESGLRGKMDAMFGGDKINVTENRAVLHVALRAPKGATILVDGKNVVPDVHAVLDKMADFSNACAAVNGRVHRPTHQKHHQHRNRRL